MVYALDNNTHVETIHADKIHTKEIVFETGTQSTPFNRIVNYDEYTGSTDFSSMISFPSNCTLNGSNKLFDIAVDASNLLWVNTSVPASDVSVTWELPAPIEGVTKIEIETLFCTSFQINDGSLEGILPHQVSNPVSPGIRYVIYNGEPFSFQKLQIHADSVFGTLKWFIVKINDVLILDGIEPGKDVRLSDRTQIYDKTLYHNFAPVYASANGPTSSPAFANDTLTVVSLAGIETQSENGIIDIQNNRFVVPIFGYYMVSGKVDLWSDLRYGRIAQLELLKGSTVIDKSMHSTLLGQTDDFRHTTLSVHGIFTLNANDHLQLKARLQSSPTTTFRLVSARFSLFRVG